MIEFFLKIKQDILSEEFKDEAQKRIKHSAKLAFQVLVLSIICFVLMGISIAIFGDPIGSMLVSENPFTSGFIHAGIEHLFYNLLIIFLFTLPKQNTHYNIKKLFWITFIISCLYWPVIFFGFTSPAVGISGTGYFLITRFAFSNSGSIIKKILFFPLLGFTLLGEYINMNNETNDGVAHGVHFLGVFLGVITLYFSEKLPKLCHKIFN